MGVASAAARLRKVSENLQTAQARAFPRIAARVQANLEVHATSRIGNVPEGISVEVTSSGVRVSAPDWVMERVRKYNQVEEWRAIFREEIAAAIRGE